MGDFFIRDHTKICEHGNLTTCDRLVKDQHLDGPTMWVLCPAGEEVTIELTTEPIIVMRDGGAIQTPYNWTTFNLEDGEYGLVRIGDNE